MHRFVPCVDSGDGADICAICSLNSQLCISNFHPKHFFHCTHCGQDKHNTELITQRGICLTCSAQLDKEANGDEEDYQA